MRTETGSALPCKGCRDDYQVSEDRIDRMLAAPMFHSDSGICVPDDVYQERLTLCRDCSKLVGGHTCALCGCFVRIAAKFKDKSCPAPGGIGWRRYSNGGHHA
jgi:hypothetical protein